MSASSSASGWTTLPTHLYGSIYQQYSLDPQDAAVENIARTYLQQQDAEDKINYRELYWMLKDTVELYPACNFPERLIGAMCDANLFIRCGSYLMVSHEVELLRTLVKI